MTDSDSYSGRFIVVNCLPARASELTCYHHCYIEPETAIRTSLLTSGKASEVVPLYSRPLSDDLWSIVVRYDATGAWHSRSGKSCNFTSADAGGLCVITLNTTNLSIVHANYKNTFSIITPTSSSCLNNRYGPELLSDSPERPAPTELQRTGQKKDDPPQPGLGFDYTGTMVVLNATNGDIYNVMVSHTCDQHTDSIPVKFLSKDEATIPYPLNSAQYHGDYWSVSFEFSGGSRRSRDNKRCDYDHHDAPSVCLIILYADDFTILTPDDWPCTHNYYHTWSKEG